MPLDFIDTGTQKGDATSSKGAGTASSEEDIYGLDEISLGSTFEQTSTSSTKYVDLYTTQYIPYLLSTIAVDLLQPNSPHNDYWDKLYNNVSIGQAYASWYDASGTFGGSTDSAGYIFSIPNFQTGVNNKEFMKSLFYGGFDLFRYHLGFYLFDPYTINFKSLIPSTATTQPEYVDVINIWNNPVFGDGVGENIWLNDKYSFASSMDPVPLADNIWVQPPFKMVPKMGTLQPEGNDGWVQTFRLFFSEDLLSELFQWNYPTVKDLNDNVSSTGDVPSPAGFGSSDVFPYYDSLLISHCKGYFTENQLNGWSYKGDQPHEEAEELGIPYMVGDPDAFRNWVLNYLFNNEVVGSYHPGLKEEIGYAGIAAYQIEGPDFFTGKCGAPTGFAPEEFENYSVGSGVNWPIDYDIAIVPNLAPNTDAFTQFTPQKLGFNLDTVNNPTNDPYKVSYVDHYFSPLDVILDTTSEDAIETQAIYNISTTTNKNIGGMPVLNDWTAMILGIYGKYTTSPNTDIPFELYMPNFHFIVEESSTPYLPDSVIQYRKIEFIHSTLDNNIDNLLRSTMGSTLPSPIADDNAPSGLNTYFEQWANTFNGDFDNVIGDAELAMAAKKNKVITLSPEALRNKSDINELKEYFPNYVQINITTPVGNYKSEFSNLLQDTHYTEAFVINSHKKINANSTWGGQSVTANKSAFENYSDGDSFNTTPNNWDSTTPVISLPFTQYINEKIQVQAYQDFWMVMYNVDYFNADLPDAHPSLDLSTYIYSVSGGEAMLYLYSTGDSEAYQSGLSGLNALKMRNFTDIVHGNMCYSEIVYYEIKKFKTVSGQKIHLQNFLLPITTDPDASSPSTQNEINFIDTQVLPGHTYVYEIFAYQFVLGNRYYYEISDINFDWSDKHQLYDKNADKTIGGVEGDTEGGGVCTDEMDEGCEARPGATGTQRGITSPTGEAKEDWVYYTKGNAEIRLDVHLIPSQKLARIPVRLGSAVGGAAPTGDDTPPPPSPDPEIAEELPQEPPPPPAAEHAVTIIDAPPVTPGVNIVPYRAVPNKLYIALQAAADEYYDWPQGVTRNEQNTVYQDAQYSHDVDSTAWLIDPNKTSLAPAKILFKSEYNDVTHFEIYRISEEDMPFGPRNYFDFGNPALARKVTLDRSCETILVDDVKPNINYYYIFRALDAPVYSPSNDASLFPAGSFAGYHRGWSNPTDVYRVKLIKSRDNVYLDMEVQPKEYFKTQQRIKDHIPTKSFKKYLMIRPTLEQTVVDINTATNGGLDYWDDSTGNAAYHSIKDFLLGTQGETPLDYPGITYLNTMLGIKKSSMWTTPYTTEGAVSYGSHGRFRIRIKSKHTGKKVDIILGVQKPAYVDNTKTLDPAECKKITGVMTDYTPEASATAKLLQATPKIFVPVPGDSND